MKNFIFAILVVGFILGGSFYVSNLQSDVALNNLEQDNVAEGSQYSEKIQSGGEFAEVEEGSSDTNVDLKNDKIEQMPEDAAPTTPSPPLDIADTAQGEYQNFEKNMLRCMSGGTLNVERGDCADVYTRELFEKFSTRDALALLQQGMDTNPQILVLCHDMAHSIGRETLTKAGKIDEAFDACDQTCHSGCYHGVMERVFIPAESNADHISEEDMRAKVPDICSIYEGDAPRFKFQCLHGIGHAVMFVLENDLATSLDICALMKTQYDRSSCWGGALMENVTSFSKASRWIKTDDPHYPCNALKEEYQQDCYVMQTSVMFDIGLRPPDIAKECEEAGSARSACFQSLGRDISGSARNDISYGVRTCSDLGENDKKSCITGLIYAFMDLTWDGEFAYAYCDGLDTEVDKDFCYNKASRYLINGLGLPAQKVRGFCSTQAQNSDVCREHAY